MVFCCWPCLRGRLSFAVLSASYTRLFFFLPRSWFCGAFVALGFLCFVSRLRSAIPCLPLGFFVDWCALPSLSVLLVSVSLCAAVALWLIFLGLLYSFLTCIALWFSCAVAFGSVLWTVSCVLCMLCRCFFCSVYNVSWFLFQWSLVPVFLCLGPVCLRP